MFGLPIYRIGSNKPCNAPIISNKYLNFNVGNDYVLDIFNPLNAPQDIIFENNVIDQDTNVPKLPLSIVEDSIEVTGDGLSILKNTNNTISMRVASDLSITVAEPITLKYDLTNGCTTATKTISGFIDPPTVRRFVSDFDYLVLSFVYTNGTDLDLKVGFMQPTGLSYVGYYGTPIRNSSVVVGGKTIMRWGGDKTSTGGSEQVLVDLKNFKLAYPNLSTFKIDCGCTWFTTKGTNPVKVSADLYKASSYTLSNLSFIINKPTYKLNVSSFGKVVTTLKSPTTLATLEYDIPSQTGLFKLA